MGGMVSRIAGPVGRTLLVTGLVAAVAAQPAKADFSFAKVCGGSNFETCAAVDLSSAVVGSVSQLTLQITNLGELGGVFARIGLMGLPAGAGPSLVSGPTGWGTPASALSGDGLIEVVFGAHAPSPMPHNGLAVGESGTFVFGFNRVLTAGEIGQVGAAAHAISGPSVCGGSTKIGINPDGSVVRGAPYSDPRCGPSTVVPEPMTVALLGTGLLGLGVAGIRRRRQGAEDLEEGV